MVVTQPALNLMAWLTPRFSYDSKLEPDLTSTPTVDTALASESNEETLRPLGSKED